MAHSYTEAPYVKEGKVTLLHPRQGSRDETMTINALITIVNAQADTISEQADAIADLTSRVEALENPEEI